MKNVRNNDAYNLLAEYLELNDHDLTTIDNLPEMQEILSKLEDLLSDAVNVANFNSPESAEERHNESLRNR